MAENTCVLAIDQGTTSSRALVFGTDGSIIAAEQAEFPQIYPRPGWVEHDGEDIWRTTVSTARAALARAKEAGKKIVAIGVANQRETSVVWDRKTLAPIHNAIVWQDRRTADLCAALKEAGREDEVRDRTGLLLDPYFSATKLAHILDAVDGARARAARGELAFGTIDSFLLARLTGGAHFTDATNASRTSLFNIVENRWDDALLEIFNAPRAVLPEVCDNIGRFGVAKPEILGEAIPIFAMIGDQQSAAIGQACLNPGDIKSTYGTGCFVLAPTDGFAKSANRLLTTIARRIDGRTSYALEGSIFIAGAAVQWLRDELGLIKSSGETQALAQSIASNNGVYLVPAFAGLGAPHWNADARGLITGLTRGAGRAEIARAALECVAYQTADLIDAMAGDGAPCATLKVDGGMTANDWLMQFLADVQNVPVDRPEVMETTAFGAAFLAGVKAGVYGGVDDIAALRKTQRVFAPDMPACERERLRSEWKIALDRALR
ncbi:MAG: glycerol kinase GlpK [Parvularculaceae bacterium]|nr:glycerol kinase GlpK [Parvularculaceae bacterium]